MALNLSKVAKLEKNKIAGDGAWLILLEITLKTAEDEDLTLRVVRNNEDIEWNGQIWVGFPFDLDEVVEDSGGELPQIGLRVSNITRAVQHYVEEAGGGVGASVRLLVIHSSNCNKPGDTDANQPEVDETFTVRSVKCDLNWVHFTLSGDFPTVRRIPETRYMKDFCPFPFRGVECGYAPMEAAIRIDEHSFIISGNWTIKYPAEQRILLMADSGTRRCVVKDSEYQEESGWTLIRINEKITVPDDLRQVSLWCNKTLDNCRDLGNAIRFGGEPGIPEGGTYKSGDF